MQEAKIHITAPMHVSCASFASGVASSIKAVRAIRNGSNPPEYGDIISALERLLAKANNNLDFNNSLVAHREGFSPEHVEMRCRVDKVEQALFLYIRPLGERNGTDKSNP